MRELCKTFTSWWDLTSFILFIESASMLFIEKIKNNLEFRMLYFNTVRSWGSYPERFLSFSWAHDNELEICEFAARCRRMATASVDRESI